MSKFRNIKTINKTLLIIGLVSIFLGLVLSFSNGIVFKNKVNADIYSTGGSGRGAVGGRRITYNFNYGWTFSKGTGTLASGSQYTADPASVTYIPDNSADERNIPYSSNYDPTYYSGTSTWKDVSLPHTYNDEDTFNNFMEEDLNGERTMYAGTAWYKKVFNLPSDYATDKTIILEFEGARQSAKVWVNGNLLNGVAQNGFVAFGYEIPSEYLHFGEGVANQNVITVLVDNSYPYYMEIDGVKTNSQVSWHDSHWHPNYGGLYRNSYLYVMDDLHLTVPLYSFTEGNGTYVYTDNETSNATHVHVDAEIENSSSVTRTFDYRVTIKDMNGDVVTLSDGTNNITSVTNTDSITLASGEKTTINIETILHNPIRWSTNYPYLYTCEVELLEDGVVIDNNLNTFGVRTFRFTTNYGFYLNEWYTELDGWGQKPTWEWAAVGAAYPDWMSDYGMHLLKDAGGNYLRFGHAAGSGTQINLADKYGILVTQPGVDGEGQGGSSGGNYSENTYRLRMEAMRDMIIYFRNHPSIIIWEIGNQANGLMNDASLNFINSISWLGVNTTNYNNNKRDYGTLLIDVINKYDYGNRTNETNTGTYEASESASRRLTTVRRASSDNPVAVDVYETTLGDGAISGSPAVEGENIRMEARRGVWDIYTEGFETFTNTSDKGIDYINSTSETYAKLQATERKFILNQTSSVGGANWIFSDSISHGRITDIVARASGEVDAVMLPKEAYYVNKVINDDVGGIDIIGHWNYPANTVKTVYVVAKGVNSVELFINGTSVGNGVEVSANSYLYEFPNVTYAAGTIRAVGYDFSHNIVFTDEITTHGEPDHLEITAVNGPTGLIANGSDILILDVKLLDNQNRVCTTYDGEVENTLLQMTYDLNDNGNVTGEYLGGYNIGVPENTRSNSLYLEAGIQRVFVRTSKVSGGISVTATLGAMSDTYTTNSIAETNNNGLSLSVNPTPVYALDNTKNLGLGDGSRLGVAETAQIIDSKLYIENLLYLGNNHVGNGVYDSLAIGELMYSDSSVTIASLPYKFINADYIRIPNDDRSLIEDSLLSFDINRNSTVYIAHDTRLPEPTWLTADFTQSMNEITNTVDTIVASNGVTYEVWKRDYTVSVNNGVVSNVTVDVSGNVDNGATAIAGANYFIFVKETSKVNNRTFFSQNFDLFSESNITYGWNAFVPANTTVTKVDFGGRTALRFTDDSSPDIAFVTKKFPALDDPFTVTFKSYIGDNKVNTWLRVFISLEEPKSNAEMRNIPVESYLSRDGNSVMLKYNTGSGSSLNAINKGVINVNAWYTYRYHVDPVAKKWYVEVFNDSNTLIHTTTEYNFARTSYKSFTDSSVSIPINKLNHVTFATGRTASYTTDFYIDDVEIKEDMDIGATAITIDDVVIGLSDEITSYVAVNSNSPSDSVVDFTETEDFYNYTRVNDDVNRKITFNLENLNGEHFIFDVNYDTQSALLGWHVEPAESVPDPNAMVTSELKDNDVVIEFNDTTTTNNAYIYKDITSLSTALRMSYDFYLDSDSNYDQALLRMFLTDGAMSNVTDYTNVGVRSYMTPQDLTTNEYVMLTKKINAVDSNLMDDTLITKDAWHNIVYYVNIVKNTYTVYLDGVAIIEDFAFYNNQTEINRVYIGTDVAGTAKYYIKNFAYEEASGYPIDGVTIDQVTLPDFNPSNDTYYYYTDTSLTNDSSVTLVTNAFYNSSTITKDVANKQIEIVATDNQGNTYNYTIIYDSLVNRPITSQQLQDLIDSTDSFVGNLYTFNTWETLQTALTNARAVINNGANAIPIDYSLAYYELETAINGLLLLWTYNGYDTATVQTIKYSSNLGEVGSEVFGFNSVLDNGKIVYYGNDANTFTSVPYRYMNAEYMLLNNIQYKNALMTIQPLQNIDILVFKDRDAGPLTDPDETVASNKFQYTGEIATSSAGVIYKIYKKSFTAGTIINIEFEKLVNNYITGNNNIIAFINTAKADNNTFINEDFDIYDEDLFNRAWKNEVTSHATNTFHGNVGGTGNYINLYSDSTSASTYGFGIIYKEMAKLKERIVFKYTVNLADLTSNVNLYNRTWLRQGPGDIGAGTTTDDRNNKDKKNALADIYAFNNISTQSSIYNINGGTASKTPGILITDSGTRKLMYSGTAITASDWVEVEVNMNVLTKKAQVSFNGVTYPSANTYFSMINGASSNVGYNGNVTYADHMYFASRLQGKSNANFRDIIVYPIDSGFYSDIQVGGVSIGNYKDMTKAYLYKVDSSTNFATASATAVQGELFTNDGNTSNPTINTTTGNNRNTTITETYASNSLGTYERDYKVYFEVDSDIDANSSDDKYGKSDLVDLLNYAMNLNSNYYTSASYSLLETAIENAIVRLANHDSEIDKIDSNDDVTYDYLALKNVIDNQLISLSDVKFDYNGKIIPGREYDDFVDAGEINITNKSSFTANFSIQARINGTYRYADDVHTRFLEFDSKLYPGTSITFIDNNTNKFYSYMVTQQDYDNDKFKYSLSDFVLLGTIDSYYENSYHIDSGVLLGNYSFIVDFKNTSNIPNGEHTITLELYINDAVVSTSDVLNFNVYNVSTETSIVASPAEQSYDSDDLVDISMEIYVDAPVVNGVAVTDTTHDNKIMAVRVSVNDENGNFFPFPKGTTISDGINTYPMSSDGYLRVSSGLPLQALTKSYILTPGYEGFAPATYFLKTELIETFDRYNDTGIGSDNVLATEINEMVVDPIADCSIYAIIENSTNVLIKNQATNLNVDLKTICNNINVDQIITLGLYKKNLPGYLDFNYSILDYKNNVNNSIATEYDGNIYKLETRPYNFLSRVVTDNQYQISFKDTLSSGMYKLEFDIRAGELIRSDFVTFVIK